MMLFFAFGVGERQLRLRLALLPLSVQALHHFPPPPHFPVASAFFSLISLLFSPFFEAEDAILIFESDEAARAPPPPPSLSSSYEDANCDLMMKMKMRQEMWTKMRKSEMNLNAVIYFSERQLPA